MRPLLLLTGLSLGLGGPPHIAISNASLTYSTFRISTVDAEERHRHCWYARRTADLPDDLGSHTIIDGELVIPVEGTLSAIVRYYERTLRVVLGFPWLTLMVFFATIALTVVLAAAAAGAWFFLFNQTDDDGEPTVSSKPALADCFTKSTA